MNRRESLKLLAGAAALAATPLSMRAATVSYTHLTLPTIYSV